jgi:hypothetical protein
MARWVQVFSIHIIMGLRPKVQELAGRAILLAEVRNSQRADLPKA